MPNVDGELVVVVVAMGISAVVCASAISDVVRALMRGAERRPFQRMSDEASILRLARRR
jgi:hypothetical protein